MKFLIDMNISPRFVGILKTAGLEAIHWSDFGDPRATDRHILSWARDNGYIIITHDLDFGAILASTETLYPSVIQLRTRNVALEHIQKFLLPAIPEWQIV